MTSRRPSPLAHRLTPAAAVLIGTALAAAASPAVADWTGGIEGGTVVRDGGNAVRLRLGLVNDDRPLSHNLYAEWLRYDDDNGYRVGYLPRFWVDERLYVFGELEGRVDRPLRIERQLLGVGGVGYSLYDSAERGLGAEVGAGVRSTRLEDESDTAAAAEEEDEESEGVVVLRAAAFQKIADLLRLELEGDAVQGERYGELHAEAALAYRVPGGAIKLGYRIRRLSFEDGPTLDDDDVSLAFTYGF